MQPTTFGLWLKQLRAEKDLTQEMLSELVGCATPTLRSFEIGTRRPSREMAERIATVLEVSSDRLTEFLRLARLAPPKTNNATSASEETLPSVERATSAATSLLTTLSTPLVGREAERNALRTLLLDEHQRLVTIVGAGGMGKTQLALDIATSLQPHFADGAAFAPLAPLRSAALLPGSVADALRISLGNGDPRQQVVAALASRHLLLVLDSFDEMLHQTEGDAVIWINQLIQQCPQMQLLITSRERLRLSNERVFELGGLSLPTHTIPPENSDAVILFLERAQQSVADVRLDNQNKLTVARICQLVDGIPLGIELAAAWVNVLSLDEIAAELESNIDFLARSNRDATPRHGSMRAVFEQSWALLDREEQLTLGRLAAFRGGCTREAAQNVAKATLPLLAGLIDKSLVRRQQSPRHARYELHEVVRQYAAEKRRLFAATPAAHAQPLPGLAQDEVWLAHYAYFLQLATTAREQLYGRAQLQWLQVLDEEHANLRAGLDRSLRTRDFARGLQLAVQLEEYWYIRGHHREGLQRLLDFLQQGQAQLSEEDIAHGYAAATILAIAGGDYGKANIYFERSLAIARRLEEQTTLAKVLRYGGLIALHEADYERAEVFANEALAQAEAVGNHYEAAITLSHLAEVALIRENFGRAQELGEQAVQRLRLLEDKNQLAGSLRRLAQAHMQQAHWNEAQQDALESLALNHEVGDQRGSAASIVLLATLPAKRGEWATVAQLLGAADYLLTRAQSTLLPADQLVYAELWQQTTTHLSDFRILYEAGRTRFAQESSDQLAWIQELV